MGKSVGLVLVVLLSLTLLIPSSISVAANPGLATQNIAKTLDYIPSSAEWNKTYGLYYSYRSLNFLEWMIQTGDGGYAMIGQSGYDFYGTSSVLMIKTDSNGNEQWQVNYGPLGSICSLIQTSDGGYAFVGSSDNGASRAHAFLLKTDSNGNVTWKHDYVDYDAKCGIQTHDGGFVLAGCSAFPITPSYAFLLKTDADGNEQWSKNYSENADEEASCVIETNGGGYLLIGDASNRTAGMLLKTDPNGVTQWVEIYSGSDSLTGMPWGISANDGGYAFLWNHFDFVTLRRDCRLIKMDSDFNVQWNMTFISYPEEEGKHLIQTNDLGYLIVGLQGVGDIVVVNVHSNGSIGWVHKYNGPGTGLTWETNGPVCVQCIDGSYVIAGTYLYTDEENASRDYFWILKLSPITLTDFGYADELPDPLRGILDMIGLQNIAVFGRFYAVLNQPSLIRKAEVRVNVSYVTASDTNAVKQEERLFELKLSGSEFTAGIQLETWWPTQIAEWLKAIMEFLLLKDPSGVIEQMGGGVFSPEYRSYIGFEKIYLSAEVTGIVGVDVNGNSFAIDLGLPMHLLSGYDKLVKWENTRDYAYAMTICPVALSVVDNNGGRLGIHNGQNYSGISNAYYFGQPGEPQLILIEDPTVGTQYRFEIEGLDNGTYSCQIGQKVAGNLSQTTLAEGAPIQPNESNEYIVKIIPEFTLSLVMPLCMIGTLLGAVVWRRKHFYNTNT